MSSQSAVKDIIGAMKSGWFADGPYTVEEELAKVIVPEEDYSKLLAKELPSLNTLGQAMVAWAFAAAKHIEALPYAVTLLEDPDGLTRFTAAVAAALLNDYRGIAAIRQQIAQPDPGMSQSHIVDGLEEAVAIHPSLELRELLGEAMTTFGFK